MEKLLTAKEAAASRYVLEDLINQLNRHIKSQRGSTGPYNYMYPIPRGALGKQRVRDGFFRYKTDYVLLDDVLKEFYDLLISNGYTVTFEPHNFSTYMVISWEITATSHSTAEQKQKK